MPLVLLVLKIGIFKHTTNHGYTIEAGIGTNPLPISDFNKIYNDNLGILVYGALPTNLINSINEATSN